MLLVDDTGRLFRDGMTAISSEPAGFQLKDQKKIVEVDESLILRPLLRGEKTFVCPLRDQPRTCFRPPGLD